VKKLGAALKEVLDKSGFGTSIMADLGDDDLIDSCCQDILNDLKKGSADGRLGRMQRELARFEDLKPYKKTSYVEVLYNAVRTGVEIYPLLGILGTIIALGLGLQGTSLPISDATSQPIVSSNAGGPAQDHYAQVEAGAAVAAEKAGRIIDNFGSAIWSTFWGLVCGIFFMMLNSFHELKFDRLVTHRQNVSEVVMWARKTLEQSEVNATT
jgi:biopolymer transport protein ExbB